MNWQLSKRQALGCTLAAALVAALPYAAGAQGLVPNNDFEIDGDANSAPDDWFTGGTTSYITTDDSDGVGIASVGATNGGDWRSLAFAVTAGEQLTWSVDYKVSDGASGSLRADLRFFSGKDAGGGTSGSFQGEDVHTVDVASVVAGAWHTLGPFTLNVPAGSAPPLLVPHYADVRLSAGIFGPALTGDVRFDNVLVTRIPEPATFVLTGAAAGLGLMARRRRRAA
jgi:hypothetical protein